MQRRNRVQRRLAEYRLFFGEFLRSFHTTGAIMPSGRFLSAALARFVGQPASARRILEVGPGTGAVTRRIIAALGPTDLLDLVELNSRFVAQLRHRFETEPAFRAVAARARLYHGRVEDLRQEHVYDLVISGVPINNFSLSEAERVLAGLNRLLKPGGTLSFFEHIAIRQARALLSGRAGRERLRGISEALDTLLKDREIRRDWIWLNLPPAWVHHVR